MARKIYEYRGKKSLSRELLDGFYVRPKYYKIAASLLLLIRNPVQNRDINITLTLDC